MVLNTTKTEGCTWYLSIIYATCKKYSDMICLNMFKCLGITCKTQHTHHIPFPYKQPHQSFHLASFPLLNDQRSQRRDLGQHGNPTRRERERHHRISICFLPPQGKMPLLWDQVKKDLVKFEKLIGFTKWLYSKVSFNLILVSGSNHTLECIGSNLPTNLPTNLCICLWLETEKTCILQMVFYSCCLAKTYPPQI